MVTTYASRAEKMKIGRPKADFRIKIISSTGQSQAIPVYECDLTLREMVEKIINALRENKH